MCLPKSTENECPKATPSIMDTTTPGHSAPDAARASIGETIVASAMTKIAEGDCIKIDERACRDNPRQGYPQL